VRCDQGRDTDLRVLSRRRSLTTLIINETRSLAPSVETPPPQAALASQPIGDPDTSDPQLRGLTLQAGAAARNGHCSAVAMLAERVERIDATYRTTGFVADASIASCLRN
jgi:hypothetical protein